MAYCFISSEFSSVLHKVIYHSHTLLNLRDTLSNGLAHVVSNSLSQSLLPVHHESLQLEKLIESFLEPIRSLSSHVLESSVSLVQVPKHLMVSYVFKTLQELSILGVDTPESQLHI